MNAQAFRHFYAYHFAENRKLWDTYVTALSPEQFTQTVAYSHGSVHNQIVHLINVDEAWFSELRGIEPLEPPTPTGSDDRDVIRAYWDRVEQRMRDYLAELQDDQLSSTPITEPEEDKDLIVWQVLLHVVNHGTDHRAQLLRVLSDLGLKTTSQDYIFYVYEQAMPAAEGGMHKAELVKWLQEEYQDWEAFLAQIGPARMEQPGVNEDWDMKDMVAHLTTWQRRIVANLQAAQRGEPEPPPLWPAHLEAEDDINAWIYASNRERSVREVLDETQHVFQQLLASIEALPDDIRIERVDPAFYLVWVGDQRFLVGEFFHHFHDDHEPDIRAWLARTEQP